MKPPNAARGVEASVYALLGEGGMAKIQALALQPGLDLVVTPRRASILLVAGHIPERLFDAVKRLHDQLPHPRASLCWDAPASPLVEAEHFESHGSESAPREVRERLSILQADVLSGRRATSAALLPDEPPAPWRGRGDHGQGGEGMMGGKPYGRPMAMPDHDLRDGLKLDAYPVVVGPFVPMFPPGLALHVTLQGDVIQKIEVRHPPFPCTASEAPFRDALERPAPLAELERLRAAHHLRGVARLLSVRGAEALALRFLRAAERAAAGRSVRVARLRRVLQWSGLLTGITPGLGRLADQDADCLQGPALRATGSHSDARVHQQPYQDAGFEPVTQTDGDVRARIRQWMDEAEQALQLASRLAGRIAEPAEAFETPAGAVCTNGTTGPPLGEAGFNRMLAGLEWGQAITVLASFDAHTLHRMLPRGAS